MHPPARRLRSFAALRDAMAGQFFGCAGTKQR